ncbi:WhiB family transcriptional regulator [Kibdelosporangium aridum]|uniref:WhiB family transcriptional regulator n=1 Tax=Kibdelosporangium aridum TaxID=2030 RepID=UPI000B27FE1F
MLNLGAPDETEWMQFGVCRETDPEAFYPEKGASATAAKSVCTGCPVRTDCLEYALARNERFGVWGGLSERERRQEQQSRIVDAERRVA